jgi:RNA polymerase sigma-70 factor (ECF subfamily)
VAARGGEEWAREALFRRHAPRLNGLAFRIMGRDDEIDDLVQDAFVSALQTLDRLEDPNAFSSWLGSILVRQAYKKIRRRRLLSRLGLRPTPGAIDLDSLVSTAAPPDVAAELRRVYAALERMPADLRIPLVLHRLEGMTLPEVAAATGTSLATVKRRLTAADALL